MRVLARGGKNACGPQQEDFKRKDTVKKKVVERKGEEFPSKQAQIHMVRYASGA
jgi:hypothetical protein